MSTLTPNEYRILRMLEMAPFERRPRGGWRFGTKCIADSAIDQLIRNGRARRDGDKIRLVLHEGRAE